MAGEPSTLSAALAMFQRNLPTIRKSETAEVQTKTGGKYKYSYADLAAVSQAVLPQLGAVGLSWVTRPTVNEAGKLVLAYSLRHVSGGECIEGEYPLSGGTPQEIGSAITYARRYCLCSVTGVAPEQDDDDAAAASRRQDDWEAAVPAPTASQAANFSDLSAAIRKAPGPDALRLLGDGVKKAAHDGNITKFQYEQLARKASARLAELAPPEGGETT